MSNRIPLALSLCLSLTAPAHAQQGEIGEGFDLLGQGAQSLLRGLMEQVEPTMKDLAQQLRDLNWQGLGIEDLDNYEAPEVLDNGDIILRRKQPTITVTPDASDDIEI